MPNPDYQVIGSAVFTFMGSFTMTDTQFLNLNGAPLVMYSVITYALMDNCIFDNMYGTTLVYYSNVATVSNCRWGSNGKDIDLNLLSFQNPNATVYNCIFDGTNSPRVGSAILLRSTTNQISMSPNFTIYNNSFIGYSGLNSFDVPNMGSIRLDTAGSIYSIKLYNCTFIDNGMSALYVQSAIQNVTIDNCLFQVRIFYDCIKVCLCAIFLSRLCRNCTSHKNKFLRQSRKRKAEDASLYNLIILFKCFDFYLFCHFIQFFSTFDYENHSIKFLFLDLSMTNDDIIRIIMGHKAGLSHSPQLQLDTK